MRHLSTGLQSILRLHEGDDLIPSIEAAMKEAYMRNATVDFGLGSLADVEVGTLPRSGPHRRNRFEGPVELVYLAGLVVGKGSTGPYSSHVHASIAQPDGLLRGGHLFSATVGTAAEVGLTAVQDTRLKRVHDAERKLDLLDL
jgi:predicted DNA-binding protein with PD1-like motif